MPDAKVIDFAEAKKKRELSEEGKHVPKKIPLSEVDWSQVKPTPHKRLAEGNAIQSGTTTVHSKVEHGPEGASVRSKAYRYDPKKHTIGVSEEEGGEFKPKKVIPASASHEKELKEASMNTVDLVKSLLEKAIPSEEHVKTQKKGKGKIEISQHTGEDLSPMLPRPRTMTTTFGRKGQMVAGSETGRTGKTTYEVFKRSISDTCDEIINKCRTHLVTGETEAGAKKKKGKPDKTATHVFGTSHHPEDTETIAADKLQEDVKLSKSAVDELVEKAVSRSAMGQYDEKVVQALKKKKGVENPFALATWIKEHQKKSIDDMTVEQYLAKTRRPAGYGSGEGGDDPRKEEDPEAWREMGERNKAWMEGKARKKHAAAQSDDKLDDAEKSLDERTSDLVKSYQTKFIEKPGKMTLASQETGLPFAHPFSRATEGKHGKVSSQKTYAYDPEKQEVTVEQTVPKKEAKTVIPATKAAEKELKHASLDDRTCDLVKSIADQELDKGGERAAEVVTKKLFQPDLSPKDYEKMARVSAKAAAHYPDYAEKLHEKVTKKKSILLSWKIGDGLVKGGRVMPLGPGGEIQTLVKDDANNEMTQKLEQRKARREHDAGEVERKRSEVVAPQNVMIRTHKDFAEAEARRAAANKSLNAMIDSILEKAEQPSYHETDKAQEDVQSGKTERERKAKKRIEALKGDQ